MNNKGKNMRFKLICCEVLCREVSFLAANSPHTCDAEFLPKGLHDLGVEKMQPRLQERVDSVPAGAYDAVLLGYGLCNNGIAGLLARDTKLVVPRAHDCITLFLGSREKYKACFNANPGTYYKTTGWVERGDGENVDDVTISKKLGLHMKYEELVQKYGEDNAKYVMETMGDLTANYDRMAFISMGLACEDHFAAIAEQEAKAKGLAFEKIQGSMDILRKLVNGDWDDDFLILQPGEAVKPSHGDDVIRAV